MRKKLPVLRLSRAIDGSVSLFSSVDDYVFTLVACFLDSFDAPSSMQYEKNSRRDPSKQAGTQEANLLLKTTFDTHHNKNPKEESVRKRLNETEEKVERFVCSVHLGPRLAPGFADSIAEGTLEKRYAQVRQTRSECSISPGERVLAIWAPYVSVNHIIISPTYCLCAFHMTRENTKQLHDLP